MVLPVLYPNRISCTWLLASPNAIFKAFYQFRINITRLGTERCCDFLYLYNGPTTSSPLIGKYSGTLAKFDCLGLCPHPSSIVSNAPTLIVFISDETVNGDGFAVSWTAVIAPTNRSGASGLAPTSPPISTSNGGGIAFTAGDALIDSSLIFESSSRHPVSALGGGIFLEYAASVLIVNSSIISNGVSANNAAGAGIYSVSNLKLSHSTLAANEVDASGPCILSTDLVVRCPASFGGAMFGQFSAFDCLFRDNAATCSNQYGTTCASNGAAIYSSGAVSLNSSRCEQNLVTCDERSGCIKGTGGCLHSSSQPHPFFAFSSH